jgi:hypothetical protein
MLNTTLCLELTESNGIFGDISDWFSGIRHPAAPSTVIDRYNLWKMTIVVVGCSISKGLGI